MAVPRWPRMPYRRLAALCRIYEQCMASLPILTAAVQAKTYIISHVLLLFDARQWMLLAARFLVGLGAGTATVARAHVGAATDLSQSTGAMAMVAGTQTAPRTPVQRAKHSQLDAWLSLCNAPQAPRLSAWLAARPLRWRSPALT